MAAVLTLVNRNERAISFQIRAFAWRQSPSGDEQLIPTAELLASPPLATIPPGGTQVARLLLHRPPEGREATYRILLDELSPPAEAGIVHIALRLSIPVFAEPPDRVFSHVRWRAFEEGGQAWLAALNDGTRRETVSKVELRMADGRILPLKTDTPPHVLAGGAHRWRILHQGALSAGLTLRLTATADAGTIDQELRFGAASP